MDIDDLKETARLARLSLSKEELAAAFPAFEQMLGFFAAMQAADKDAAAFPASGTGTEARAVLAGHFRPDTPDPGKAQTGFSSAGLIDSAGERDGRFILVPGVL